MKKPPSDVEFFARRSNPHHLSLRGWSYLHYAAQILDREYIRILKEWGAVDGIRTRDEKGETAFEIAVRAVDRGRGPADPEAVREVLETLLFGYSYAGEQIGFNVLCLV